MLRRRKCKLATISAAAVSVLAVSAGVALATRASTEDTWVTGANSAWSATSSKTTFTSSVITITCTTNTAGGSSVSAGPDRGFLAMNAPKFSTCKDNLGGTDTVTSKTTGWKIAFVSDIGNAACPSGTGKDEASGGTAGADCVVLTVPIDSATITVGGLGGCKLTTTPTAAKNVGASVKDPGGTTKDTFTLTNQQIPFNGSGAGGCGATVSGTATFSGTYTLHNPNGGVLVDKS